MTLCFQHVALSFQEPKSLENAEVANYKIAQVNCVQALKVTPLPLETLSMHLGRAEDPVAVASI
jgi:hypothetical protein